MPGIAIIICNLYTDMCAYNEGLLLRSKVLQKNILRFSIKYKFTVCRLMFGGRGRICKFAQLPLAASYNLAVLPHPFLYV